MHIRGSPDAAADLDGIVHYIRFRQTGCRQAESAKSIYDRLGMLGDFPYSGRPGRVDGTREFPLSPLPFIAVYRVIEHADVVEIVNVIHGAQRWPPAD